MTRNILNLAMAMCILIAMDYHFTKDIIHELSSVLLVSFFIIH